MTGSLQSEQRRVLRELRLPWKAKGSGLASLAQGIQIADVKHAVALRVREEQANRDAERERRAQIRRLEESGRPDRLSGVEREAERLFELVCDRPGITRAESLGVVPSEAGWDDLVACSDIELVVLVPGRPAGAFSAVRLIHARDSIMKALRAARGGWVNVRKLREASPYSNGYRGAAMKTLGCIEFDGNSKYRRIMECISGRHNYEHLGVSCDDMDAQLREARRIALMPGTSILTMEEAPKHGPGMYKSGFSHDGSGESHAVEIED